MGGKHGKKMITREADYSIRAILYLAGKWPDGYPVPASVLAGEMDIPYRFLRRIIRKLGEAGFVASERGRTGGIRLARNPADISLLDLLESVDSKAIRLNACLDHDIAECKRVKTCPVHREMNTLQTVIDNKLGEIRFSHLTA